MARSRALFPLCLVLIASCATPRPTPIDQLQNFVTAAAFAPPPGSIYPTPTALPARLQQFVASEYDRNSSVRRLAANYYLRYDGVLLRQGLIDAEFSADDLVGILWKMEAQRQARFDESPSTLLMRRHIETNPQWFDLGNDERSLLQANNAVFAQLQTRWQQESQ